MSRRILCYCDTIFRADLDPTEQDVVIFRETAFDEARQRAATLIETCHSDDDLEHALTWDVFQFRNPAYRNTIECAHCGRLLVTGRTWSAVQVLRPDHEATPTGSTGRGSTGFVAAWEEDRVSGETPGEIGCYCGNALDLAAKPRSRGLVIYAERAADAMLDRISEAIESGIPRDQLSDLVLGELFNAANPVFRHAVQCERCTRILVLNDANQVVKVYIEHPDDVPADTTGPGSKGLFDDTPRSDATGRAASADESA